MRQGMGVLGWSPPVFWAATPHEFNVALLGWAEAQGIDVEKEPPEQITRREFNDLMARFPD